MAASASRISSSAPIVEEAPMIEMPMLPRTTSSLPATINGWRRSSSTRSATSVATSVLSRSSSSTTNSSPPKRAAVSLERMLLDRRLATSISAASPAPWPRLSLIVLKSSMSRNITPSSRCSRRARPIACRTRSTNSARLARLVTGSWNAWWASCSSKVLRSEMSRAFSTMPRTCSSSSRFVCRISNWRNSPSRWRSVHSMTCPSGRAYAEPSASSRNRAPASSGATRRSKRVPRSSCGG